MGNGISNLRASRHAAAAFDAALHTFQATRIPFYQAFDVLNMYHLRGIQYVTGKR